jgi:glycosyltransferase involved in cell wall biosynthesis
VNTTKEELIKIKTESDDLPRRVVVVTHDAHPHGAQYIALQIVKELATSFRCEVEVVCLGDGPLKADFARSGSLHDLSDVDPRGAEARRLAAHLFHRGFRHAIVNTTVGGLFLLTLKEAGLRCVALIHELRDIIVSYGLQMHAQEVAAHADYVVFPAPEVRHAFSEFASVIEMKVVVRPQGLFKRNAHASGDRAFARRTLRLELGLQNDARIILAVGYADLRKGVDYFVEIAARLVNADSRTHLVWVGHWDPQTMRNVTILAKEKPALFRHIHFIGRRDDTAIYYAGADVFALTSREDPFPCVVLEAMDAGLPIVAFSGSGGANALIDEGLGENVAKDDVPAFAAALRRIVEDSELRNAIAHRGQELIAERFSFRHYLFELLRLAGLPIRKVSVLIPNYNYERYLADRIATILKQTYPIYEVIFLDDASTDNSLALARSLLSTAGIDYLVVPNPVNSGSVSLQWKRGTELARGDFVWIAEADDLSDPTFLATFLRGLDDPGVVLSYCESKQIDQFGAVLANNYHDYVSDLGREHWVRQYVNSGADEIGNYMAVKNTIPNVSAVVMRLRDLARVLAENIDDIRSYRVAGDWKTYLHLLPNGRLAYFPQSLNLHRRHRKGITIGTLDASQFREVSDIQKWVASRYSLTPNVEKIAKHYLTVLREQFGLSPSS